MEVPLLADYGEGLYRRTIRVRVDGSRVRGALEDDFHHLEVRLEHDGARVTHIEGAAPRIPWTTCPGAAAALQDLVGLGLSHSLLAIARATDPRRHCTHGLDLATLCVTAAARGLATLEYRITVPDRRGDASLIATLDRDGQRALTWSLAGFQLRDPAPFAGRALVGGGFASWCEQELEPDTAEAAQVLRRACMIAMGRRFDMDRVERAASFGQAIGAACHTFREPTLHEARRVVGASQDHRERQPEAALPLEAPD